MSINDLPEDVVKHEIMSYLKPPYKVWEVTYLQIRTEIDYSEGEAELNTTQCRRTGLFRLLTDEEVEKNEDFQVADDNTYRRGVENFNPYNGRMSQETLDCMEDIRKSGAIEMFYRSGAYGGGSHVCCIYVSHRIIAS
tara:strand:- start:9363 stop:9776 length:414 start_codon:yes stop_codon:yes gene_type:complete